MKTERDQQILAEYENYDSISAIAARHGVTYQLVMSVVRKARRAGLVTRPARAAATEAGRNEEIAARYLAGATLQTIGDEFGLTRERVRQVLARQGVTRRTVSEHTNAIRESALATYGPLLDAAFNETRSISQVVTRFQGQLPARWVREYLAPRRTEVILRNPGTSRWADEDMLACLRLAAAESPTLSIRTYRRWREDNLINGTRPPNHSVISWRFGSWSAAVIAAGLHEPPVNRRYTRRWSDADTSRVVATYVAETLARDERPTFIGYDTWSRVSKDRPSGAYVRHLTGKSWSELMLELSPLSV
jgi:transposase-like protein